MNRRTVPIRIALMAVAISALAFAIAQGGSSYQKTKTTKTQSGNASSSASASASSNGFGSGSGFAATPNYAAVFVPGPRFDAIDGPEREALLQQQAIYHAKLAANLKVLHFGPWRDHPGGLVTLLAKSDEEARSLIGRDPTVVAGFYEAEVRAWNVTVSARGSVKGGG